MAGRRAVIAGIGESDFGASVAKPLERLQQEAIDLALLDAQMGRDDVQALFTDAQIMDQLLPIDRVIAGGRFGAIKEVGQFSLGGVGVGLAIVNAVRAIETGDIDCAVVYFGIDWASRPSGPYGFHSRYPAKQTYERPHGFYGQPTYYALLAQMYAERAGISAETLKLALGHIAVQQRDHARRRGRGQQLGELSLEDHRRARMISTPLGVNDCCVVSDGAAAIVLSTRDAALDRGLAPVTLEGWGHAQSLTTDESFFTQDRDLPYFSSSAEACRVAFEKADANWEQIDVLMVYDCFTISVLLQLESIGFWRRGSGAQSIVDHGGLLISDGTERPIALNTHGGFLSQAYLLGINHVIEAVRQLRGEAGATQVEAASRALITMAPTRDSTTLILGTTK